MRLLIALVMLKASTVSAATLSPPARDAFYAWHLCVPRPYPSNALEAGSRRFAHNALTFSVENASSEYVSAVRTSMAKVGALLAGVATYREVPWSSPADLTWRIGTSLTQRGVTTTLTNGCAFNPTVAADKVTITSAEIVCKSAAQVGVNLAMHEVWWHGHLSFCDGPSGFAHHASADGAPLYEGVPGHREIARWIYSVPAGSLPPR